MPENTEHDEHDKSVADCLEDLFYTGVGLGVLAVNRAQVARRRLQAEAGNTDLSALAAPLAELGDLLQDPERLQRVLGVVRDELKSIDERVDGIEQRLVRTLDSIEPELPPLLREMTAAMRSIASEHAEQVRAALGLEDDT